MSTRAAALSPNERDDAGKARRFRVDGSRDARRVCTGMHEEPATRCRRFKEPALRRGPWCSHRRPRVLCQTNSGQSTGGGVITYVAGGRQLLAVASGMTSPVWPGGASQRRIVVYGLR